MSIGYRSSGSVKGQILGNGTITIPKPANLNVGDLMLAHIYFGAITGSPTCSKSGWTNVIATDGNDWQYVFWKFAASGDVAASNFVFSTTGAGSDEYYMGVVASISAWTGVNTSSPIDYYNTSYGNDSLLVIPQITPNENSMIILMGNAGNASTAGVSYSGYTIGTSSPTFYEAYQQCDNSNSSGKSQCLAYGLRPQRTATSNGSMSTNHVVYYEAAILALNDIDIMSSSSSSSSSSSTYRKTSSSSSSTYRKTSSSSSSSKSSDSSSSSSSKSSNSSSSSSSSSSSRRYSSSSSSSSKSSASSASSLSSASSNSSSSSSGMPDFTFSKYLTVNTTDNMNKNQFITLYSNKIGGRTKSNVIFHGDTGTGDMTFSRYVEIKINGNIYYTRVYKGSSTASCCSILTGNTV